MQTENLTRLEEKAYREYHSVGHVEFFIGLGLLLVCIADLNKINEIFAPVIMFAVFVPIFQWKKWVMLPRVGHVEFRPEIIKREAKIGAFVMGVAVVLVVAVVFILYTIRDNFRNWFEGNDAGVVLFLGLIATICFLAIAIARKSPIHYGFALLNVGVFGVALIRGFEPTYSLPVLGIVLALYGAAKIQKFLKQHPKQPTQIDEPTHPASDIEFSIRETRRTEIYDYFNSDGMNEFMLVILYVFIGFHNSHVSTIPTLLLFLGFVVAILWRFVATKWKMGKVNFRVAREMERNKITPIMNLIGIIPFIVIYHLHEYLPKEDLSFYKSVMDILLVSWFSVSALFYYYYLNLRQAMLTVVYSFILYVALSCSHLPKLTIATTVAMMVFVLGLAKVYKFLRATPPQPLEVA